MTALSDKHVVVTGGGRGIGAAIAAEMDRLGARITLMGRTLGALQARAEQLARAGAIQVDVTDEKAIQAGFDEAMAGFGPVDILVNNAGTAYSSPFARIDSDNWQQTLAAAEPTPRSRLRALVRACFAPRIFNRKKISVWYAFWGETRSRPKYMRICGERDAAFSATLFELCEALAATTEARLGSRTAALSIEGMIDVRVTRQQYNGSSSFNKLLKRAGPVSARDGLIDQHTIRR